MIVHLDLDCFYCQVDREFLGISGLVPLATRQWDGLIAVNYPARALGVSRFMSVSQVNQLQQKVEMPHVSTFKCGDLVYKRHSSPNKHDYKVSLDDYRNASHRIMQLIGSQFNYEKASIDEVFLDLSHIGQDELSDTLDWSTWNVLGNPDPMDGQMHRAAVLVQQLRTRIQSELGFTCSAGIAPNKTLAKLASSMYKPNQQTIVRYSHAKEFMRNIEISKIRGLGGKRGLIVQERLGVKLAGQVAEMTITQVTGKLGHDGVLIHELCNGICREPVQPPQPPKQLTSHKDLIKPYPDEQTLHKWVRTLAGELHLRISADMQTHQRFPHQLSLQIRTEGDETQTQSIRMRSDMLPPESLALAAGKLLSMFKLTKKTVDLLLIANKLEKIPTNSITKWISDIPIKKGVDAEMLDKDKHPMTMQGVVCKECGKALEISETWQEHADFHIAAKLDRHINRVYGRHASREFNAEAGSSSPAAPTPPRGQKRASEPKDVRDKKGKKRKNPGKSTESLLKFFQPTQDSS